MDIKKLWEEFFTTWKAVVTQPEDFFSKWNQDEEWQEVIKFNVICGILAGLITTVFTLFTGIGTIILYPIFVLIGTVIGGVILFVCFKVVGGAGDVEPTIKMVGYTQAMSVISMGLPIVGIFASFYQLWLLIVGGRVVQKLETGKAAIAVLIPVIVMGVFFVLMAIFLGIGMMSFMAKG